MELQITPMAESDVGLLTTALAGQGTDNRPRWLLEDYIRAQADGQVRALVARADGEIAGYAVVSFHPDYPPFQAEALPYVDDLIVMPELRRRGVGSALMNEAERVAGERSDVVGIGAGVGEAWGPALRLYVLRGYVPDGRGAVRSEPPEEIRNQLGYGDDLIVYMTKRLR